MSQPNELETLMLELINEERSQAGLPPLRFNGDLNEASEDHSEWMLETDTFSHTGENGSSAGDRIQQAGYELEGNWTWGENIAWQSERGEPGLEDDVRDLHESLMNSPGHRANILSSEFDEIGIGIERGDFGSFDSVMVTQNFGATDATPEPNSPTQPVPTPPTTVPPVADTDPEPPMPSPVPPPQPEPPVIVNQPILPALPAPEAPTPPVDQPSFIPPFGPPSTPRSPDTTNPWAELFADVFDFTPQVTSPPIPQDDVPEFVPPLPPVPPTPPIQAPQLFEFTGFLVAVTLTDGLDLGA